MEQNLFDWLNERHSDNSEQGTDLLLAPRINVVQPEEKLLLLSEHEESSQIEQIESEHKLNEQEQQEQQKQKADIQSEPTQEQQQEDTYSEQEEHTGFMLSLDEPPPELWTRINNPTEEDDDEEEYEQGTSLQDDAYVPKRPRHGTNFTQRLQKTLQGRKERAAKLREDEEEKANHHPYIGKAAIMCGTMLLALVLSWVCLWFMQKGVAAYVERARAEQQQQQEQEQEQNPPEPLIVPITPKAPSTPPIPTAPVKSLMTFDEALTEANHDYNIGMYSRAVMNFHRALTLRENDIRPYIGLAASYRARGMYFDAKRLLDEARRKFGRNPAIEIEEYYLRRE